MSARLFAALELPAELRGSLGAFGRAAAEGDFALRAVAEDAMHLTLAFLGHRALEDVDPACAAILGVRGPAPSLQLGDALWLAPRRPHVLTVSVVDHGGLEGLHRSVVGALAAAVPAWEPETRPLRPHVTVARVRRGARPRTTGLPALPRGAWTGSSLVLFRSHLGGRGPARHEALARTALR